MAVLFGSMGVVVGKALILPTETALLAIITMTANPVAAFGLWTPEGLLQPCALFAMIKTVSVCRGATGIAREIWAKPEMYTSTRALQGFRMAFKRSARSNTNVRSVL